MRNLASIAFLRPRRIGPLFIIFASLAFGQATGGAPKVDHSDDLLSFTAEDLRRFHQMDPNEAVPKIVNIFASTWLSEEERTELTSALIQIPDWQKYFEDTLGECAVAGRVIPKYPANEMNIERLKATQRWITASFEGRRKFAIVADELAQIKLACVVKIIGPYVEEVTKPVIDYDSRITPIEEFAAEALAKLAKAGVIKDSPDSTDVAEWRTWWRRNRKKYSKMPFPEPNRELKQWVWRAPEKPEARQPANQKNEPIRAQTQ